MCIVYIALVRGPSIHERVREREKDGMGSSYLPKILYATAMQARMAGMMNNLQDIYRKTTFEYNLHASYVYLLFLYFKTMTKNYLGLPNFARRHIYIYIYIYN